MPTDNMAPNAGNVATPSPMEQAQPATQAPNQPYQANMPPQVNLGTRTGISTGRYIAGGLVGTFLGFGIGHGISGIWKKTGWIFTFGEIAAYGLMFGGAASAAGNLVDVFSSEEGEEDIGVLGPSLLIAGGVSLLALHIWEIVDIWTRPKTYSDVDRTPQQAPRYSVAPLIAPALGQGSAGAFGLTAAFRF